MKFKWLGQGLAMLVAGMVLLLGILGIINFSVFSLWPLLLLALAYTFEQQGWAQPDMRRDMLLPGGILLTYGSMFMLCEIFGWSLMSIIWPGFFMGPALGMYQQYLANRQKRGQLITARILAGIGCAFFVGTLFSMSFILPVMMIALGAWLLLSAINRSRG